MIGQRNRKTGPVRRKQNARIVRAVVNQLAPIFNAAFKEALNEYSEDNLNLKLDEVLGYMLAFYQEFISELDKVYPPDLINEIEPIRIIKRFCELEGDLDMLIDEIIF